MYLNVYLRNEVQQLCRIHPETGRGGLRCFTAVRNQCAGTLFVPEGPDATCSVKNAMTNDRDADRVWKLIEKIGFCMLSTLDGEDIRARPMAAHVDRDAHAIYFLTDLLPDRRGQP